DRSAAMQTLALRATGAQDSNDVAWAMRATMGSLGDEHSYLLPKADIPSFYAQYEPTPPVASLRADGVAVLALSQAAFDDPERRRAYAREIRAAIADLSRRHPNGWIVDLRGAGGGDMWSVLAGLSSLVGIGEVGAFRARSGLAHWFVRPGE